MELVRFFRRSVRHALGVASIAIGTVAPVIARAADAACATVDSTAGQRPSAARWQPPLDRVVNLQGRDISLREALDRLAAQAHVRLSYVSELLPLDRRVCDNFESATIGDALVALLRGTTLEPVVAGPDQVVLAPARRRADSTPPVPLVRRAADVLDRVVVTGSVTGAPERPLAVALDVVSGKQLEQRGVRSFAEALDESVPGMWMWSQSPSTFLARYGSIRGASSFQLSYPKVYIDGIEVANPLLLTQFGAEAIDRIEVIRGPQGAALYGADAISGVINIVTRHEPAGLGGQRLKIRSDVGMSHSDYSPFSVVAQDYAMTMHTGTSARSAGLGLSYSSMGEYIPGGYSRQLSANGDVRMIGAQSVFTAFVRAFSQRAGPAESPLVGSLPSVPRRPFDDDLHAGSDDSTERNLPVDPTSPQAVAQYTVGATGKFSQDGRWTHSVVLGADGYRLSNVALEGGPIPSPTDSALRAARGSADRGTLRLSSVGQFGSDDRASATLTLAVEHTLLREATAAEQIEIPYAPTSAERAVAWRVNTGVIAQSNLAFRNALFVTGGIRLERNDGYTEGSEDAVLPMVGAAFVRDLGGVAGGMTLKLRAAYGKGTRPPRTSGHDATWMEFNRTITPLTLRPEVQSGVEAGADLLFGRALSLHATRFDQRASDLIQAVAIAKTAQGVGSEERHVAYELQNVGEISNRGWELQGTAQASRLALTGALSLVESRVVQVTSGYSGDLRPGDRMLEVPARTLSLTASWYGSRWFTSWRLARASDWINYDRLALARDLADQTRAPGEMVGTHLRDYWREYPGVTRLRATFSRDLVRGMSLVLTGDNLLNRQRSEPDNVTIVPGRTIALGLRASF